MRSTRCQISLGVLIFLINAIRMRGELLYPAFYAESGAPFFIDSIELGMSSIFTPIIGHYLVLQRTLCWIATFAPLRAAPLLYAFFSGAFCSWVFALFCRPGFRWIVGSDRARFVICIAISLLPGSSEIFFSFCTLYYAVTAALLLLLLEQSPDGKFSMSTSRMCLLSFFWFSTGHAVIFMPLLGIRYYFERNRLELAAFLTLCAAAVLNVMDVVSRPVVYGADFAGGRGLVELLLVYVDNSFFRLLFNPLLGGPIAGLIARSPAAFFYSCGAILLFAVVAACKRWNLISLDYSDKVLFAAAACVMLIPPLSLPVRAYLSSFYMRPNLSLELRYAFLPALAALLLAGRIVLGNSRRKNNNSICLILWGCMLANLLSEPLWRASEPYPEFESFWPSASSRIQSALELKRRGELNEDFILENIPCRPKGWEGSFNRLRIAADKTGE